MTLKKKLADLPYANAGSIDAPELGPGEKIHIARLTFGERETLSKIATDPAVTDPMTRMRKLLVMLVAEEDGSPAFGVVGDYTTTEDYTDGVDLIPAPLADRIIEAGMEMNSGRKDAKKPSSPAAN